jgi:ATP-binding protein involved in chromosome partitioning
MKVPFLGEVPIDAAIREGGDIGKPVSSADEPSWQAKIFEDLARTVVERAKSASEKERPTISISD